MSGLVAYGSSDEESDAEAGASTEVEVRIHAQVGMTANHVYIRPTERSTANSKNHSVHPVNVLGSPHPLAG